MKKYILFILFAILSSCAYFQSFAKPIWSIDTCEIAIISKCNSFCKLNKGKVEEFSKTVLYYSCICTRDMEAKFYNACE